MDRNKLKKSLVNYLYYVSLGVVLAGGIAIGAGYYTGCTRELPENEAYMEFMKFGFAELWAGTVGLTITSHMKRKYEED